MIPKTKISHKIPMIQESFLFAGQAFNFCYTSGGIFDMNSVSLLDEIENLMWVIKEIAKYQELMLYFAASKTPGFDEDPPFPSIRNQEIVLLTWFGLYCIRFIDYLWYSSFVWTKGLTWAAGQLSLWPQLYSHQSYLNASFQVL